MSNVSEIGNKVGLSFLAVQILEAILAAGRMLPPAELARSFHVQPGKVRDIVQDVTFQQAYHRVVLGKYYYRLDEVVNTLTEQAIQGKLGSMKLYLQLHGLIDSKAINHITANQFNLGQSPEEVVAKRKELERTLIQEMKNEARGTPSQEIEFESDEKQSIIDMDNSEVIRDN